jgi:DNA-binding transcriptional LysR family regulator
MDGQDRRPWWRGGVDLKRLQYFAAVAAEGSFHGASARLNIAQPTLSRQVRELEDELDVQLFIRSTKGVRLSPAGAVFLAEVERLLPQVELACERARRAKVGQFGELRIAYAPVAADSRFAIAAYADARRAMPDVEFRLSVVNSEAQLEELEADRIDLAIGYSRGAIPPGVASQALRTDTYMLAVWRDHPLTRRRNLKLGDLAGEDFVFAPRTTLPVTYSEWMRVAHKAGLEPNIVLEAHSEAMFLNIVAEGLAIGFANSSLGQRRPLPNVTYLEVEGLDLPLRLTALWRRDRETPALRLFVELLLRRLAGSDPPPSA